jgi:protoheme IX farnesyltransferase
VIENVRTWTTRVSSAARDYLSLAKPRVILLHLLVAAVTVVLATSGSPSLSRLLVILLGGALAAAGANALNCYLDRDLDSMMERTRLRPLPQGRLKPSRALIFGLACAAAGIGVFRLANGIAAALAAGAIFFYVVVYTLWLKRSTPASTVIGGAAGALPPLIAWAAATGDIDIRPGLLCLIVFLWTPPHFWALALSRQRDYIKAGLPVVPAISSRTNQYISLFAILLVGTSLAFGAIDSLTPFYLASAAILGICFLYLVMRLLRRPDERAAGLYRFSSLYLALLFGAMLLDVVFVR